jgi:hypothetical protein
MGILNTTLGNIELKSISRTVKTVIGGLWPSGNIDVVFYTSENEGSGIVATYNAVRNELVGYRRINVSFISEESRRKYGRRNVDREILPIYKTK